MGLFGGLFGGSSAEKETRRIRDLSKRAQEKYGDPAARHKALEQLRDVGSPEAISALLQRFTVKTEPGIVDAEEKDFVVGMITSFGDTAVDPVKEFLRTSDNVAWGIRCLESLVSEDEVTGIITSLLEQLSKEYAREPDKKVVLINHLLETKDPRITPALLPFLEDPSDEVRTAALAVLVRQHDEQAREPMIRCFLDAESPRVRAATATALSELGWSVGDRAAEMTPKLPRGFTLDDKGVIRPT